MKFVLCALSVLIPLLIVILAPKPKNYTESARRIASNAGYNKATSVILGWIVIGCITLVPFTIFVGGALVPPLSALVVSVMVFLWYHTPRV